MVTGMVQEEIDKAGRQLGATGETVRENIRRIRDVLRMPVTELSAKMDALGRPIPPLGIRRIEAGERRVDVDDLTALAVALEVSPETLLMPYAENANDEVRITGWEPMYASEAWRWMQTDISLGWSDRPPVSAERALPPFVYRALMEDKAARIPELRAKFEERKRKRKYGLSDGDD
jgi:transcriptional regulator with XRE-family HTH domain